MKLFKSLFVGALSVLFTAPMLISCEKDEPEIDPQEEQKDPKEAEREKLIATNRFYMKKYYEEYFPYYFWHDDVEQRVKNMSYDSYVTIDQYFYATLFSEDRWSWMMTAAEYLSDEAGEKVGTYGVSLRQAVEYYNDYSIRVAFIYPGSPFEQYGVTRGWTLTHLDSIPVMDYVASGKFNKALYKENQLFTFKDTKGESHTFRSSPLASLFTRSSLKAEIFTPDDYPGLTEPVGYFHYLSFDAGDFLNDIHEAMAKFKEANVHKLILDLRYNGGGDGRASNLLVSYLAPDSADNKVYRRTIHNKLLSMYDSNDSIHRQPNSLDLDALYVIGGGGTASASEVTINGLKPYMDLYLVGDTTYGKPNGMYVLLYPGEDEDYAKYNKGDYSSLKLVYLPIAFFSKNSLYESIPYNGFIPDNYRADDLRHDFGVEEDNIKACLEHIVSGVFPALPGYFSAPTRAASESRYLLPADDDNDPLHGYTVLPVPDEMRKAIKK